MTCPEPKCREELIDRINCAVRKVKQQEDETIDAIHGRINKKLGVTGFVTGCAIAVSLAIGVATIGYNAYAGRISRVEETQKEQQKRDEQQTADINAIKTDLGIIRTKQGQIIETLVDMKKMLEKLTDEQRRNGH